MKKITLPNIAILQTAAEGKTLARHEDGRIIFVEGAVPGDVVDVQVIKSKKDYIEAKTVRVVSPSPDRVVPFCQHFGVCGGCKWQQLRYEKQAEYKQQLVDEALRRIGKLQFPPLLPIIKAPQHQYYRNKLEFTFSNKRWLTNDEIASESAHIERNAVGFHIPGMFDRIVDIQHCHLQSDPSNAIRNSLRQYALQQNWSFYDVKEHRGFLRNLIVRTTNTGEVLVILSVGYDDAEKIQLAMDFLVEQFPHLTSYHYVVNTKKNDTLYDLDIVTYHGRGFLYEQLEDLRFKVSPKSFFQTNTTQALALYQTARQFAQLQPTDTVYDLYTGTGSIGIFMARQCEKVIGIEEVEAAIADANYNAQLNGFQNTHFYAGDVKKLLTVDMVQQHGKPDVLITDPPRAGMHADVIQILLELSPRRIVYVSCNPSTQARDLQLLAARYNITQVQPVDMFPHTFHIENVVALELA